MTFNRRKWFVLHGADPGRWAARWGIEPGTAPCYSCKRERTTTVPFAVGALRGLAAPTCKCGNQNGPYCVVAADGGDVLEAMAPPPAARPARRKRARRRLRAVI